MRVVTASESMVIFVAIQWHISDILGSERDVASGSVRMSVYTVSFFEVRERGWDVEVEVEVVCSSKIGADFTAEGEMVLPRFTVSWADG